MTTLDEIKRGTIIMLQPEVTTYSKIYSSTYMQKNELKSKLNVVLISQYFFH